MLAPDKNRSLAIRNLSLFAASVVLTFFSGIAAASDYPRATTSYKAQWISNNTINQTTGDYECLDPSSAGGAEGCVQGIFSNYPILYSPWTAGTGPGCGNYGYIGTTCYFAALAKEVNGIYFTANVNVGQWCVNQGIAGVNIHDAFGDASPDTCFIQYQSPTCNSPLLLDPQSGVCYSPPEKHCNCSNQQVSPHPIDAGSGNEYLPQPDYRSGGAFPLIFTRTYNSGVANEGASPDGAAQNMGVGWNTNLGSHLFINTYYPSIILTPCIDIYSTPVHEYFCVTDKVTTPEVVEITIWRPDGSQTLFSFQTTNAVGVPQGTQFSNESGSGGVFTYVALPAPYSGNGYQYRRTDGFVELYDPNGVLLAVSDPSGLMQIYQYNASSQLTSITGPFGRQLSFTYDSSNRITTLTSPAGVITYGYDSAGNLSSVTYPDNSVVQYLYEDAAYPHALTGLKDEDNNRYLTWGYDSKGRATSSSEGSGNIEDASVIFNADGSADITEATGLVRHLTFTSINHTNLLASASAPCVECGDKTQAYTYDSNGFVSSKTDFDGNVTQYVHDAFGNETSRTEAYGTQDARTITTQWDDTLNRPSLITEPGRTTGYTYDSVGHVLTKTVTDTATDVARVTTYTYYGSGAANGLLDTVTDPLGHVTSYAYDNQGNLASVTNALNQVTQITSYDANGMPLTIVDPNGVTTTLTYDARQRLLTRTVAGAETQFAYDPAGNLTKVTLPTGSSLSYTYDAAHRLTGISDALGDSISYTLDHLGNRTGEKTYDPTSTLKKTLQRTYNNLNQLLTTVGGASQTTTYTDDTMGNVSSIQDPMTNVTGQTFDALNRLQTMVDPESGSTKYSYDALDRVQDVTDPRGLDTHYTYDAFGDVLSQQSPDTGTTSYTYDLGGNRLTKTDARGIQATYTYDALNRLAGITYPDASRDVTYTYDQGTDGIGHLTGMSDAAGITAYTFDAHGNTTQKTVTLGGHAFTTSYQYDTADNLTGMTYPSGLQVSYGRDAAERISSVAVNSAAIVSGITYEPFGPITGFTYGNGLTETRTYDQDYRLTGIKVPGVLDWTLGNNADDDITSITDNLNGAKSQTLGYDNLNRLTSTSGAYGSQGYTYDLDGNRTQETGGTALTLGYDTASNKLLNVGSQSDTYDAAGNLISDGSHTYSYDDANRMTGYDTVPTAYLYNGLGQRAIKFPRTPPSLSAQTTFASGNNPYAVVMADLNGDGKPDMVTTNDPDGTVSVFENQTANGAASPSFAPQQTIAVGSYPESVTIADVNGDGLPDIITANSGDGTITVLLNTTASSTSPLSFSAPYVIPVGTQPEAVLAVDLNGDGVPDLAVANYADATITVLFNNTAAGTSNLDFTNQQTFQLTGNPMQLAAADLNGDGLPDLVATIFGGGEVAVLLNGTTTPGSMTPVFADPQYVSVGGSSDSYSLTIADLNGDHIPDIAVVDAATQQVAVLVNSTAAGSSTVSFDAPQYFALGTDPQCIMAVDLDLDGRPDLVVANYMSATIGVLHNTTTAGSATVSFDPMQTFSAGSQAEGVAAADINGDGKPDVVVTDNGVAEVGVFLNTTDTAQAALMGYYTYDESGHVIGEYDQNGNPIEEHIYLGDRPVAVVQGGNAGNIGYVTTDQLNTPRAITDGSKNVEWNWSSDPFGNGQPTGSLPYNLRFPGQYYDAETGHNYNYQRDYDPTVGRYVESDPIGLKGGLNTYAYVDGNPTAYVDKKGTATEAMLGTCVLGGPADPLCDIAVIINGCKWIVIAGAAIIASGSTCQGGACNKAHEEDDDKNCEELYQSTLRTCASLTGRKRFMCFEAARENREQCYQERNKERGPKP